MVKPFLVWPVLIVLLTLSSNPALAQLNDDSNQYFVQEMIGAAGGSALGGLLGGSMGFITGIVLIGTCPEDAQESSTNETLECSLITSLTSTGVGASIGTLAGALVGISLGLIESSLIFITTTALETTLGFNWDAKINPSLRREVSTQPNWEFDLPLFDLSF